MPALVFMFTVFGCDATVGHAEEPPPVDQEALNELNARDPLAAFLSAFEAGDELTEADFTTARGVGAHVAPGLRFTRYPRADLKGAGEWATHMPPREGGPQAQSCISCHALPYANGAGSMALNVAIDPLQSGDTRTYLERNTLPLFALGAVQRVAEEMTAELHDRRDALAREVCDSGVAGTVRLEAKGVDFGTLGAAPQTAEGDCTAHFDTAGVDGVDDDLVIRMFGWKGNHATIRQFTRGAAHNELGMQADELVGEADGDHDGVVGELTIGDLTAMTLYMAALERPTSLLELADNGLIELPAEERASIEAGQAHFATIGCAACHRPLMVVDDPVFSEPSRQAGFFETVLPSGADAEAQGLSAETAISFDLTADSPNNHVITGNGETLNLGAFERDAQGRALVRWYTDFKRHEMGPDLADPVDAYGIGASVWPTRSLAGVGSTGPWLHHGHATTLGEAITAHGGDAARSRDQFEALSAAEQAELLAFLENLIIIDLDPEEGEHS